MKILKRMLSIIIGLIVVEVHASDIVVSWETNGVLKATGMLPGSTCTVEWASTLADQFTNSPTVYQGMITDTNGTISMQIPMYFRVKGIPDTRLLTNGLVAYYPFVEDANDYSGNEYNGTTYGTTLTNGISDQAYSFDGYSDYIRIGSSPNFPSWENYTVSAWFLHDGGGSYSHQSYGHKIIDRTSLYHDFYLCVKESGDVSFKLYEDGVTDAVQSSGYNYQDNTWHHVAVTKHGNLAEMVIDGELIGSITDAPEVFSSSDLLIGYSDSSDYRQQDNWSGNIDNVRIYNRALSVSEIQQLYQESL